jgi:hypothetical protein
VIRVKEAGAVSSLKRVMVTGSEQAQLQAIRIVLSMESALYTPTRQEIIWLQFSERLM